MQFQGQEQIGAPSQTVWAFLVDPHHFTACAPGLENVRVVNDREFTFDVSAAGMTLRCTAAWVRLDPPRAAQLSITGGDFFGRASMTNDVQLSDDGSQATLLHWSTEVQLSGLLGRLAGPRVASMVESLNQDVFACLRGRIEARAEAPGT
ncbi:MAG TPA: SRPBCC domain-containing protein [Thermomicrobiaceae bacterium]|nr:SRPBCC domain-containing protein [Thermomicrobiaceae bacterium]